MTYKVVLQRRAERDIGLAYEYIEERSPQGARKWYVGIKETIQALASMPTRCHFAAESEKLGFELRETLYGKRSAVYRVVFRIDEGRQEVHILTVRHGARQDLEPGDLT